MQVLSILSTSPFPFINQSFPFCQQVFSYYKPLIKSV